MPSRLTVSLFEIELDEHGRLRSDDPAVVPRLDRESAGQVRGASSLLMGYSEGRRAFATARTGMLDAFLYDMRFAARPLRRNVFFAGVTAVTLGLGVVTAVTRPPCQNAPAASRHPPCPSVERYPSSSGTGRAP